MTDTSPDEDLSRIDLASEAFGGAVLWANDEFFAPKDNLLRASEPVWKEHEYTDRGKWMDGWETRRRREPGHDHCIIRLGIPGRIERFVVDTSYFRGNYPAECSIEGCCLPADTPIDELHEHDGWVEVLERSELEGHSQNTFDVGDRRRFTHLRLHIYPDGGVARLRVLGHTVPDPDRLTARGQIDLVGALNGGTTTAQSDMFFGVSQNLLKPERAPNMGDGWETKRRRGPGHDWVVIRFAGEGIVERAVVDTDHFKGNYPDRCTIELFGAEPNSPGDEQPHAAVVTEHKLQAHTAHEVALDDAGPATHAVLRIYPDGGVSRLRLWGRLTDLGHASLRLQWLNAMHDEDAHAVLLTCCGSEAWASTMVETLPFADADALLERTSEVWHNLERDDWLEAFAAHPKIGEQKAEKATTDESESWSKQEQSGTAEATEDTKDRLARLNHAYYDKHGFIFIICATGKSADEMLSVLEERLQNDTETEIRNAAAEQLAITKLRLQKWLTPN